MTFSLHWLAGVLRDADLTVVEQPGWQSRGRGEMGPVRGVLGHHTAGARSGNAPSLGLVQNGRPDLPGPLSQLVLGRDGTFFVVAAGRCNHAGQGLWQGVTAGNSSFIGIEAENMGTEADPWPEAQVEVYARGVAAILRHVGVPVAMCAGHKEYALPRGRKVDPSFDMSAFRLRVASYMALPDATASGLNSTVPLPGTNPRNDMLRRGSTGPSVRYLQGKLGIVADGDFGRQTENAVIDFQTRHGLRPDGLVGPATWGRLL